MPAVRHRGTFYQLVDLAIGGDLEEHLRRWGRARVPYRAMARLIQDETGVRISDETIRRWVRSLPPLENGGSEPSEAA